MTNEELAMWAIDALDDMSRPTYSAVYLRPCGSVRADWIKYSTLDAAMLGPEENRFTGRRLGYVVRPFCGPPMLIGPDASHLMDLAR